ncbi:terminase [Gilliamella apicola]|uniref:PBSX family phage terminase large subunit n=1 Tax=Gilliamella apicola TaxID=1196095 RepID=UPI000A33EA18|nr:PBSX family phage terminase large subunit [Gilliamella apicola]OTP97232.1 terminase [Gilliamella apicola]OTQ19281.1 terminase [Gilliamella apicola]OTQ21692.1 terminase [Gilliamella apicola]OTQ22999.1 terminase [Gilliamella apicola]
MITAQIQIPPKLIPVFTAKNVRYRGAYGGRGSAKTRTFALMTAITVYQLAEAGISGVILCAREFMNSLTDSSMEEIKKAIQSVDWLNDYFDIGERYIRTRNRRISYVFCGLRHNLDSIKSKAHILLCWVDEAENVSEMAWRKLTPTVREDNSEIWVTWNPEINGSPTDLRFRQNPSKNSAIVELNYNDNPFFPDVLEQERLDDLARLDYASYAWIWEGAYLENSDKQVLNGKYVIQPFDNDLYKKAERLLFGADFGYANDPNTLIRSFILNDCLYIEYEAYGVHVELNEIPSFYDSVPESRKWAIKGDCSRPETISYIKREGFKISAAKKWQGSVEDGISHLRGFKQIIIHPRCKHTAEEARLYSYKTDRVTEEVLPIIEDKNNHCWDAIRYSLEGYIKQSNVMGILVKREQK